MKKFRSYLSSVDYFNGIPFISDKDGNIYEQPFKNLSVTKNNKIFKKIDYVYGLEHNHDTIGFALWLEEDIDNNFSKLMKKYLKDNDADKQFSKYLTRGYYLNNIVFVYSDIEEIEKNRSNFIKLISNFEKYKKIKNIRIKSIPSNKEIDLFVYENPNDHKNMMKRAYEKFGIKESIDLTKWDDGTHTKINYMKQKIWKKDGVFHRDDDKPAVIDNKIDYYAWFKNGNFHRDGNKPIEIFGNGYRRWMVEEKIELKHLIAALEDDLDYINHPQFIDYIQRFKVPKEIQKKLISINPSIGKYIKNLDPSFSSVKLFNRFS